MKNQPYFEEEQREDQWKAFVDIFATICLTFFFIMIVLFLVNAVEKAAADELADQHSQTLEILKQAQLDLEKQEEELEAAKAQFLLLRIEYDENLEKLNLEKMDYEEQVRLLEAEQLELIAAQDALYLSAGKYQDIAERRLSLYQEMETLLKEILGDNVRLDTSEQKLYLDSEVFFETNSAEIQESYREVIRRVKQVLFDMIDKYGKDKSGAAAEEGEEDTTEVKISFFEIRGHTDLRGTGSSNRELSTNRANAFINEILPNGSEDEGKYGAYFLSSGISKFDPAAGTLESQTEEEMAINRRIEIVIRFDDKDIDRAVMEIAEAATQNTATQAPEADSPEATPESLEGE